MDCTIKSEQDTSLLCIACLRKNDYQTFEEHEVRKEIVSTYKQIIQDHIKYLEHTTIKFCFECMEKLSSINDFQKKCVQSIQILNDEAPVAVIKDLENETFFPLIKIEENIFYEELKIEVPEKRKKSRCKSGDRAEEDKAVMETKGKVSRKRQKNQSKNKIMEAYCTVCCNTHPDSHKHAIDLHTRGYENGTLTCLLCNQIFKDVKLLIPHLDSKHQEFDQQRKCGKCEMTTKSREEFLRHVNVIHSKNVPRLYTCDFCDSVFKQSITLKYHLWRHFGALKCNFCEKSFFDRSEYDEHIEAHKKRLETLTCDLCGYVAQVKPSMKKHMLLHHTTPEEQLKCHSCDKLFKAKFLLTRHLYSTHKEKTLPCCHCGKKFKSNNTLKKHMNKVHNMTPTEKNILKERFKPRIRKYACDQIGCEMKFYHSGVLKKHKFSHSKTRPYNCHMCQSGYYSNDYLRKHYLRIHGIVYTPKEVRKMCGFKYNVEDSD